MPRSTPCTSYSDCLCEALEDTTASCVASLPSKGRRHGPCGARSVVLRGQCPHQVAERAHDIDLDDLRPREPGSGGR